MFICRKFESGLAEQQATLCRLQQDLSVTSSQKTESEKRCARLQEENGRLASRISQLENDNAVRVDYNDLTRLISNNGYPGASNGVGIRARAAGLSERER